MLNPGDIKIITQRQTWVTSNYGNSVQGFEISFTVRDHGPYSVTLPVAGYTAQLALDAITAKAQEICDTLDLFK